MRTRAPQRRPGALAALAAACALLLAGCGDTLQVKPVPHNVLESLELAPFPVYWDGIAFRGLGITEATHDVAGAYTVQYGNCLQGGQGNCTPPLRVVTSPNNGFVPGGAALSRVLPIRGRTARVSVDGRAISIATGPVVLDIYAKDAALALAAARAAVTINAFSVPGEELPAREPDTGWGARPLPLQRPPAARPLGGGA